MTGRRRSLKYLRNIFLGELAVLFLLAPIDLKTFFLSTGILTIIFGLFSIINVIVDGRTVKVGKGFSAGGGYSNRLLVAKFLQATFGNEHLYDRGHGMKFDGRHVIIFIVGIINIAIYALIEVFY